MLFMLCFCTVHVVPIVTLSYHQALVKEQYRSEINSLIFCSQGAVLEVCNYGCRKQF